MSGAITDGGIAIVPAGGRSRRMGRAVGPGGKAAAIGPGGDSLLGRVCKTLTAVVPRVIVVAADGQPLPALPPRVEVIRDSRPAAGPLAAIADGLRHAAATGQPPMALLAACDQPWLTPAVARLLIRELQLPAVRWAVPLVDGHPQVLLSAIAADLAAEIEAAVAAGQASPRQLLAAVVRLAPETVRLIDEAAIEVVDPGCRSFADIDTPEDLAGRDAPAC